MKRIHLALLAAGVFALLLLRPAYIAHLRGEFSRKLPADWAALTTNGSFTVLVPHIQMRLHDEALYGARVRQILVHGLPYHPYWRDERGIKSWTHQFLGMYIMAGFVYLASGDLNLGWILGVAILGTLWFLLFYAVFRRWTGSDAVAVPLALFSVCFPDSYMWLLDINFDFTVMWERWLSVFFQQHSMVLPHARRLPSNLLTHLVLFALFAQTWRMLGWKKVRWGAAALLGVGYGLQFPIHSYEYVYGMATMLVLLLCWRALKLPSIAWNNLACTFSVALVLGAAYMMFMVSILDAQTRLDTFAFEGFERSHHFFKITLIHALFAGLGWSLYRREAEPMRRAGWLFLACAQIAILLCRNKQVVLGVLLFPFHYIPLGSAMGCLMLVLWLGDELAKREWWDHRVAGIVSACVLALALAYEKSGAENTYLMYGIPRDSEKALAWVDANLPVDAQILSLSVLTNRLITLYSHAKVQVAPPDPNIASPLTMEKFYSRIAQLLKTTRADPDRFFAERWPLPAEHAAACAKVATEQRYLQKTDVDAVERILWFYPNWLWDSDEKVLAGRRHVKDMIAQVPSVEGPFYMWVNADDRRFLRDAPEKSGGRKIYTNETVALYAF